MNSGIEITLDRPRRVKYTFVTFKTLQLRLGNKAVGDIFTDLTKLDVNSLQTVLWVGLLHEDRSLRYDKVEEFIERYIEDGHTVGDLLHVINEAVKESGFFGRDQNQESKS